MEETSKPISRPWLLVVGWVLANFFGIMIAGIFGFAFAYIGSGGFGAPVANPEPTNPVISVFIGLLLGIFLGAIVGGFQSLSIERYLHTRGKWFLVTVVGFTLSVFVILIADSLLVPALDMQIWFWIVLSLSYGILQGAIIKKTISVSGLILWILANIIQGLMAGILGTNWILEGAFYWGITSIIPGLALVWLLSVNQTTLEQKTS